MSRVSHGGVSLVASRLLLDYLKLGAISLSLGEVAMVGE